MALGMEERKRLGALLIENLEDSADLKTRLPRVALDPAAAAIEGTALYAAVTNAIGTQAKLEAKLAKLRKTLREKHKTTWAVFTDHYDVAEVKITDIELRELLQIKTLKPDGRPAELTLMGVFYRRALENAEALALMGKFGTTQADLEKGRTDVEEMEKLERQVQMTNAKKIEATRLQGEALDALDAWRFNLYKYIDIVTEDAPEIRKAVGME